jgi:hypothetical protein
MKVDMEKEIWGYLERHPRRTVVVNVETIETGNDDDFLTYKPGLIHYTIIMEDGTKTLVPFGSMFPE